MRAIGRGRRIVKADLSEALRGEIGFKWATNVSRETFCASLWCCSRSRTCGLWPKYQNKLSKGKLSTVIFFQCLTAIEASKTRL
jgi:hypothetical protein